MSISKKDIALEVAQNLKISQVLAKKVLQESLDVIVRLLQEGKKITYIKFRFSKNITWEDIPKKPVGVFYK
jgi:nucleoid DNA-binding protein